MEEEQARARRVRALEAELCGQAHRGYSEQWEAKVSAQQFLLANEATAAASARAVEAAEAAAQAAYELRAEEELRAAVATRAREERGRRRKHPQVRWSDDDIGGASGGGDDDEDENEEDDDDIWESSGSPRRGSSSKAKRQQQKKKRAKEAKAKAEAKAAAEAAAAAAAAAAEAEQVTDLALDGATVGAHKVALSAAALAGQWQAAIDLVGTLVGEAAAREAQSAAVESNPHLPVARWSTSGGWAKLATMDQ